MALEADLVPALAVLAILLGVHAYNILQVRRPARAPALSSATMLGRFASHKGHVVGEVVAITTDRIILRQSGVHKAVPLSQAKARDGDVVLEGDIDWAAAEDLGAVWARALDNEATP